MPTKFPVEASTVYHWDVKLPLKKSGIMISPEFAVGNEKFIIELYPFGHQDEKYVLIYLHRTSAEKSKDICVEFMFKIGEISYPSNYRFTSNTFMGSGVVDFCSSKAWTKSTDVNKFPLIADGKLAIICAVKIIKDDSGHLWSETLWSDFSAHLKSYKRSCEGLLALISGGIQPCQLCLECTDKSKGCGKQIGEGIVCNSCSQCEEQAIEFDKARKILYERDVKNANVKLLQELERIKHSRVSMRIT